MKLDTLVGMAKETAAFGVHPNGEYIYSFYTEQLQAFASLIAQHEREMCAGLRKEVELKGKCSTEYEEGFWDGLAKYEDLIRARGQAK